ERDVLAAARERVEEEHRTERQHGALLWKTSLLAVASLGLPLAVVEALHELPAGRVGGAGLLLEAACGVERGLAARVAKHREPAGGQDRCKGTGGAAASHGRNVAVCDASAAPIDVVEHASFEATNPGSRTVR